MKPTETESPAALPTSPCDPANSPNSATPNGNFVPLYQKCLDCPSYGVACNRVKLESLADINAVRDFHRKLRAKRAILLKQVYAAAYPVSESTINEYFSKEAKDFKWTTVATIDNALMAICGNRVGLPPLTLPCPTATSEIQEQNAKYAADLEALREENHALQQKVTEVKGKVIAVREEVKADYASRVTFLRELCEKRQADVDELKAQAKETESRHRAELARMDSVAADYLSRIDAKNKRLDALDRKLRLTVFFLVAALIALTCYIVWDFANPGAGFFQW